MSRVLRIGGAQMGPVQKADSRQVVVRRMRRSGITTLSTSAWVSMPNGPSARVEHTISGPFANRNGSSAASRPRVTASFEFGLTTRIRRGDAFIGLLTAAAVSRQHRRDLGLGCTSSATLVDFADVPTWRLLFLRHRR